MGRDDQGNVIELGGQAPGQAGIPGVGVNQVGFHILGHLQVQVEGLQGRVGVFHGRVQVIADHVQGPGRSFGQRGNLVRGAGAVEGPDGHVDLAGQGVRELFHMHAGSAVNVRREFPGQ